MIGRTELDMQAGDDRPGRITRLPGGVAMNIAMTLGKFGLQPALLSVIGRDEDGNQLMQACADMGLDTQWVLRRADLPTDRYMAVESAGTLIAAIADAHSLEQAGDELLAPLRDGRLGDPHG
jgi:sugar/nucleoside kinase (ribokinase family)